MYYLVIIGYLLANITILDNLQYFRPYMNKPSVVKKMNKPRMLKGLAWVLVSIVSSLENNFGPVYLDGVCFVYPVRHFGGAEAVMFMLCVQVKTNQHQSLKPTHQPV